MAPAAREEKQKLAYDGLGAGGKFLKAPFRRTTQATPYDRPPTTVRNPSAANDGWLSKLIDPAQRLITSSAHRLFSSVFRKRLPPPQSPSTGVNHEANITDKEVAMNPPRLQKGTIDQSAGPSSTAGRGKFTELEQILEQKTFTRSEIDRLTALLHSRTVDIPSENQERRTEVIPSKPMVSHESMEEFPKTPVQDKNGIESRLALNPIVSKRVLDEDVAAPAELAKAYMGSRPSKVPPLMLGQAHHEDTPILSSLPFASKLPKMSLVPRTSGKEGAPENGFVTPRSWGRSAIYSMARTPYSRVRTTSTFKGSGSTVDVYSGASSSSQSVWEQSQSSGSKRGASKRRFSVLDNDIGSVGPIRRIRQKPNLLASRGLSPPVSSTTILGTQISSDPSQSPSSSIWKPLSLGEPKHKALSENGDNAVPITSFSTVPSKSSTMASKILEQLDNLVSPKEKSSEPNLRTVGDKLPTKLSPSMLRGRALKSLEDVDSSKFLDNVHNDRSNSKLGVSFDQLIPDARDFTFQKQDQVKEKGPLRIGTPCESSNIIVNGDDSTTENKDIVPNVKTAVSAALNSVVHPPQNNRAFKMSAHEDYLELDDDDNSKLETSNEKSSVSTPTVTLEKPPTFSEGSMLAENGTNFSSPSASSSSMTILSTAVATQPSSTYDKVARPKESHAGPPIFNVGGKVTSMKDSDAASPEFNFVVKVDKVAESQFTSASSQFSSAMSQFSSALSPAVGESVDVKFGAFSHSKLESPSSVSAVEAGVTNSVPKPLESDKADGKNNSNSSVSFGIPETAVSSAVSSATSTAGIFTFGISSNNSILNNGSSPLFSPSSPSVFNSLRSPNSSGSMTLTANANSVNIGTTNAVTTNSSNVSSSAPTPPFSAAPSFKFESFTASTAVTSVPVSSSLEPLEGKKQEDNGFGNLSSTSFGGTSTAIASTGSSMFSFGDGGGAATSTANQLMGSLFGAGSGSVPISQASSAGAGITSFSQSAPTEPSSASSLSFGLARNTAFSSGSSIFGSTSAVSSGASTALGSSTSTSFLEANSIGSSTAPSLFGSSGQHAKSHVFTSTLNSTSSSTGFSFGASSAAPAANSAPFVVGVSSTAAATNSVPIAFGASTVSSTSTSGSMLFGSSNGASSASTFSFTSSAASSAPSQPAFGNPNPASPFGSLGNNDQMNMEDSMAEDTNQASTLTVPVFGQQPPFGQQPVFAQQPVSTPQSGFGFASTVPAPSPFQFSSQQNLANPQNPSSFQPSGSLGVGQGGSFSLGTLGGEKASRRIVKVKHNRQRKK